MLGTSLIGIGRLLILYFFLLLAFHTAGSKAPAHLARLQGALFLLQSSFGSETH